MCGEGLMPAGVAVLERMGLAETVGGAPFYGVRTAPGLSPIDSECALVGVPPSVGSEHFVSLKHIALALLSLYRSRWRC